MLHTPRSRFLVLAETQLPISPEKSGDAVSKARQIFAQFHKTEIKVFLEPARVNLGNPGHSILQVVIIIIYTMIHSIYAYIIHTFIHSAYEYVHCMTLHNIHTYII